MKKNITVNIFGTLYPIDEDAYAMLNSYLLNMRDYFSRQPDGKEIADDIEARAAELMSELMQSGAEAISIEHVSDIISRIGNPEEMSCAEDEAVDVEEREERVNTTEETLESQASVKKRLFRDPDHKFIAGVCAGLGCYWGINPLWLRLLAIVLIWPTFGIIVAAYIICWICIPMAVTPAERLQMKGKPVNASNICQEFLNTTREMMERTGTFASESGISRGVVSVLKWLVYGLLILLAISCILAILGVIISLAGVISTPWDEIKGMVNDKFPMYVVVTSNPMWLVALCGASLLILLILTLYGVCHGVLHLMGNIRPMSNWLRVACVAVWVIALVAFISTSTNIVSNVGMKYGTKRHEVHIERENERVNKDRNYLESQGWTIVRDKNLRGGYTRSDMYYNDADVRYPHAGTKDNREVMEYEIVRHEKVTPGVYRLTAAGRTDGRGVEIFAVDGKGARYASEIPVCGNRGGSIWQDAKDALEADSLHKRPDHGYLRAIYKANDKKGYGWSEVVIDDITVGPDSILTYGVTNVTPSHSWEGTWFSVSSFNIFKIQN